MQANNLEPETSEPPQGTNVCPYGVYTLDKPENSQATTSTNGLSVAKPAIDQISLTDKTIWKLLKSKEVEDFLVENTSELTGLVHRVCKRTDWLGKQDTALGLAYGIESLKPLSSHIRREILSMIYEKQELPEDKSQPQYNLQKLTRDTAGLYIEGNRDDIDLAHKQLDHISKIIENECCPTFNLLETDKPCKKKPIRR